MKKILSVLFSICLLFLIVCCDAESISETGLKLQKIKEFSVGYAHTASTANLDKAVDYAIATASVNNGILSPLGFEQLSVISSAVLAASESSADCAELEKIFNKKVEDPYPGLVTGNKPNIHKLFEIVDDLQAELINMIDLTYKSFCKKQIGVVLW